MLKTHDVTIKVVPIKRDSMSFNPKDARSDFFSNDDALELHLARIQLENDSTETMQFVGQHLVFVNE